MADITGIDIHGGLRIRFDGDTAAYSSTFTVLPSAAVRGDVEHYEAELDCRLRWVQRWLIQYRRQQGEPMERPGPGHE